MTEAPSEHSYRDPAGFVFFRGEDVFRQINKRSAEAFELLHSSGLYDELTEQGLLVRHEIERISDPGEAYAILRPQKIPFISYPYEWCFEQLQDAALATLQIQIAALNRGLTLKDATAFNIQFLNGSPVFIDTLSFEVYEEGQPWMAYNEFCRHFLAPLLVMAYQDLRLGLGSRIFLDGWPLDLASALLPRKTRFSPFLAMHIHLHAKLTAGKPSGGDGRRVSKEGLILLLRSLEGYIRKLSPKGFSKWSRYYKECTYTDANLKEKEALVASKLDHLKPTSVWDLGANTGRFSKLATERGAITYALDADPWAVSHCYREAKERQDLRLFPLVSDLRNPTPALGWRNQERQSLLSRVKGDLTMSLALVHHIALGGNVPFGLFAKLLRDMAPRAIVEFVPLSDPQSQGMIKHRESVFDWYTQDNFERAFEDLFVLVDRQPVGTSGRILYLYESSD
jgi:hypothetical protein